MSVIVVGSVAGAPGATSLALGLAAAWPTPGCRRVLIEADADGGRLGAELGVGVEPGLMAIALATRTRSMSPDDLVSTGAATVADWLLVPAPSSAEQSNSALVHAAVTLAEIIGADNQLLGPERSAWIVDAGRLTTRSAALALAKVADRVLIVTHGSFAALALVPHRVEALRVAGCRVDVVVVEPTPWSSTEIAGFVGADVVAVLPRVRSRRDGVAAMRSTAWRPWWSAVEALAATLVDADGGAITAGLEPVTIDDQRVHQ